MFLRCLLRLLVLLPFACSLWAWRVGYTLYPFVQGTTRGWELTAFTLRGACYLSWEKTSLTEPYSLAWHTPVPSASAPVETEGYHLLGFTAGTFRAHAYFLGIPCWFLALLSLVLFVWV